MQAYDGVGVIVVISDGNDTCSGDPCGETKRIITTQTVGFKLHTVGYTVNEKQRTQLACMAKVGGGEYFAANSAKELEEIVEKQITLGRILVNKPSRLAIKGWELIPDGETSPSMLIKGGVYSQGVLWAEFPVPFGHYTMRFHVKDRATKIDKKIYVEGGKITEINLDGI